jgi:hypothetical protein
MLLFNHITACFLAYCEHIWQCGFMQAYSRVTWSQWYRQYMPKVPQDVALTAQTMIGWLPNGTVVFDPN